MKNFKVLAAFFTAVFLGLGASLSYAGDVASHAIIGFSKDGRYFAFEQFGVPMKACRKFPCLKMSAFL